MKELCFEAFKDTRLLLPQSVMRARSEVKRSAASSLKSCRSFRVGLLSKEIEKCKVESSAYEWIGEFVTEKRSLMNNRKRVDDRTEPCGTPLLIGLGQQQ